MAELAESSLNGRAARTASPLFLILSDLPRHGAAWPLAAAQIAAIRDACTGVLGFEPDVRLAPAAEMLAQPEGETFVIPAALDFSLRERDSLGQRLAEERRKLPNAVIHHDDVDPGHPLVVETLGLQVARALNETPPQQSGLILAASGEGDSGSRAQSYRLMRLLWEQLGFARGEVAFVRHSQPFLAHVLERCANDALPWIVLFQGQWEAEHAQYARVMMENAQRSHAADDRLRFAPPPGAHPLLTAWYAQRIIRLWQEKRTREAARTPSLKRLAPAEPAIHTCGAGLIARVTNRDLLT